MNMAASASFCIEWDFFVLQLIASVFIIHLSGKYANIPCLTVRIFYLLLYTSICLIGYSIWKVCNISNTRQNERDIIYTATTISSAEAHNDRRKIWTLPIPFIKRVKLSPLMSKPPNSIMKENLKRIKFPDAELRKMPGITAEVTGSDTDREHSDTGTWDWDRWKS